MNNNKFQSIWFEAKDHCSLKNLEIQTSSSREAIIVQTLYSLISQGTEQHVFSGNMPTENSSKMEIPYQINAFNYPFNYGYSLVGKVLEGPAKFINKTVHLLHPHTSMAFVNAEDCTLIPNDLDNDMAPLLSQMQTAITAIWDSKIVFGDKILIQGFGLIGALIACILKSRIDSEIEIYEPNEKRNKLAKSLGFNTTSLKNKHEDINIVFYCTSNSKGLDYAMKRLITDGKLVHVGWFGNQATKLNLGTHFHLKRINWISSQVSVIPPSIGANWTFKSRNELAFKCLKHPIFKQLSKKVTPFSQVSQKYKSLLEHPSLIQLLSYN